MSQPWDDVWVEYHPTAGPLDAVADGAWTRINLPLVSLHWKRGYQRGQQRVEAMSVKAVWRDPGRTFDPTKATSATYQKGRRQIRGRATVGGVPYTLFRGLWTGWTVDWQMGHAAGAGDLRVTMSGTDRSVALEGIELPSVFRLEVADRHPLWWFPMEEGGPAVSGVGRTYNAGSAAIDADLHGASLGSEPVLPYDSSPSVAMSQSPSGYGEFGGLANLVAPFTLVACFAETTGAPPTTSGLRGTGAFYAQTAVGDSSVGDIVFGISWDSPAGLVSLYIDDPSVASVAVFSSLGPPQAQAHIASGVWDGSVLHVKVDDLAFESGPVLAPPVPVPRHGRSLIGNTADFQHPFDGRMGHLIAFSNALLPADFDALHGAALHPWRGLTSGVVVGKILDRVGIAAGERNVEAGSETMGSSRLGASALTCLNRVANTETGLFFFDRNGNAAFYGRTHVGSTGTARDTNDAGTGHLGLIALKVDMDDTTYFTVGKAFIATPTPKEVDFVHANAANDGALVWNPEGGTEYIDEAAAVAGATRAVGAGHAIPHYTGATSRARSAAELAEMIVRDVWDVVPIIAHPMGDTVTQNSLILQVEHDFDGVGLVWDCTLTLQTA